MKLLIALVFLLSSFHSFAQWTKEDIQRYRQQAQRVTIIRDNYGIPHIYGKSDADAVFGLMYAQCEDDFKRVDMNYAEKLGILSSVNGELDLYNDLLNRIVLDHNSAQRDYDAAPIWLKKLCNAFADGINYYISTHPNVKSVVGKPYEPWFPLLWTDGSIGAINTADVGASDLRQLYSTDSIISISKVDDGEKMETLTGSNGFAFGPSITQSGNAILYINPHVTFYFRPEVHMVSEEGLNAYGAVTWGQFFIYQGFNEHCGWMHTSSQVDAADSYVEQLMQKNDKWYYEYNRKLEPVVEKGYELLFRNAADEIEVKKFRVLFTHHGPIMAKRNDQWISVRADNRLLNGLIQCWERTKATGLKSFEKTLSLAGNISNNTVYADGDGNIGYWHGNRIPKRDTKFAWDKPVDGTIGATEWKGIHKIAETIHVINPPNGWLQNCNSTPFTVAGNNSPKQNNYPAYMSRDGENFRGVNAIRTISEGSAFTIDKVIAAGYDTRIASFEVLLPAVFKAYDNLSATDSLRASLGGAITILKQWDYRSGVHSVATTLAIEWIQKISPLINRIPNNDQVVRTQQFAASADGISLLQPLALVLRELESKFGKWQIEWGEINRFQRISSDINQQFDDTKPSIPVGFVSSAWGMLPSYNSRSFPGTNKKYGVNGNSFICAVEFIRKPGADGKRVKAKSLLAGGQSGDPASPHFFDQGLMYSKGEFKEVNFYKQDVLANMKRQYKPGFSE